ncbi:O-antigen ligase family protein [Bradyrhizobium sp. Arg237L]|uniref:O-antigen ligase family protein n=1 Tax=Bradyrhizobium sp. Arg237L TaxID=3003352 RepID=UPI00249F5157|nr:O-antigen ligase family protein [Bradyrhizobium sp. Arg237L]MDI4233068.1 O-antigen ligase family protein [Bradyrhizobium sp. Arg237L]
MSTAAGFSPAAAALPAWRNPAAWTKAADIVAVLLALSLPWSTSLVGIFGAVFVIVVAPTLDLKSFLQSLKRPIVALPIALFLLAVVGMLWSDAPWGARTYALSPTAKLLVLPFLLYHFERSTRGMWVFTAFLISCTLLVVMSWLVFLQPSLSLKPPIDAERGIFVKNYIDQSQEFTLCAVALAYPIITLLRAKRFALAGLLVAIALSFFVNMAFVIVSRTALVTVPVMLAVFAFLHLSWRSILIIAAAVAVLAAVAWQTSPQLHSTAESFSKDYREYKEQNRATSIGLRLEYWRKSLGFIADAPLIGHGTGSIRGLFAQVATEVSAEELKATSDVVGNPHNQTLNVAVQWGIVGVVILYAIWFWHLRLFRGEGLVNWIGLLVVVQNIFTSLFNSHIFDFHEGWMYVLGVGVAGGIVLKAKSDGAAVKPLSSVTP